MRLPLVAFLILSLVACVTPGARAQSLDSFKRGRQIAEQKCSRCHAVGRSDERPHAIVTPFRDLHERYPIDMLLAARDSGVISGHDEMPMFELSLGDMHALLVYIDSFAPPELRYAVP
jgi:cytochrome c553